MISLIFWLIAKIRSRGGCIHPTRVFKGKNIYCGECHKKLGRVV